MSSAPPAGGSPPAGTTAGSGRIHPLSAPLQGGVGFLPHPSSAASSASLAVRLPSRGGNGVTSFIILIDPGARPCLSAGGATSATGENPAPVPDHVPFGPSLSASLARSRSRPLSALHLGWPFPGLLAPDRRDAGSRRVGSRSHGRSEDRGYVVPQASDPSVAGDARWGSRPMAEHRVMSGDLLSVAHYRSRRCYESQGFVRGDHFRRTQALAGFVRGDHFRRTRGLAGFVRGDLRRRDRDRAGFVPGRPRAGFVRRQRRGRGGLGF